MMATITLTNFILARIAEEEANAADCDGMAGCHVPDAMVDRRLAECEAKRRRVELFAQWDALCAPDDWPEGGMEGAPLSDAGRHLLRNEATVYADHPDYREEWTP